MDTPPEATFDQMTQLAARVLKVPVALVSLVDDRRQFFKAQNGLPEPVATQRETPLTHSFCQHVVAREEPLVVTDAHVHPLVKDNAAVHELSVKSYMGMPLKGEDGHTLGALCAIDTKPRQWTEEEQEILRVLAEQVSNELTLRSSTHHQAREISSLRQSVIESRQMLRLDRHDLRTPLNALMLGMQSIPLFGPVTPQQQECLDMMRRNGEAMAGLINQMLDIGNIEHRGLGALELQDCHPLELVALALEQVAPQAAEKRIDLVSSTKALLPIPGDGEKLVRVLVNLLGNAIKFTNSGGKVEVDVRDYINDGRSAVYFSVLDNGIGIAPEHLDHIFGEGYRVDKTAMTARSTGLGLTFCKRVVDAHGGRIWVESELGKGSAFVFSIPTPV